MTHKQQQQLADLTRMANWFAGFFNRRFRDIVGQEANDAE